MPVPFAWCHPGLCRHRNDGNGPWQTRTYGLETVLSGFFENRVAECGAVVKDSVSNEIHEYVQQIIKLVEAWDSLPHSTRQLDLAAVSSHTGIASTGADRTIQ